MKYPVLFKEGLIGKLVVKNRLVMSSMVRNYATEDGLVTPRYVDHIARIAQGGVGLMMLEATYINNEAKGFKNELGIYSDATIPGLRKLVNIGHKNGAKIGIQLYHAGRQTKSLVSGLQPIAPSPIPDPLTQEVPREMTLDDIERTVRAFAAAALRAKKAGFDLVELHGAHGYLINQFLSPFSNQRHDAYGGSFTKRLRFLDEVYQAVRSAVGPDFCITLRLSGDEMVEGGLKIKDTIKIARHVEEPGINALHISVGNYASLDQGFMMAPMSQPDGLIVKLAAAVRHAVSIPVIAVGKLRDPKLAEQTIVKGSADFIALGRSLLADPEWPNKVREGRIDEINHCVACNQGCLTRLLNQQDVWCTVNPSCGREREFAKKIGKSRRVLVVGGGPAGMSAALTAANRGHKVRLVEKLDHLGGQLVLLAEMPHCQDWDLLRQSLIHRLKDSNVDVWMNTKLDCGTIREGDLDALIIATGSENMCSTLPGVEGPKVVYGRELLEHKAIAQGKVVVVGGNRKGAMIAEYLAGRGHDVTIVESSGEIASDATLVDHRLMLEHLNKLGVKILTKTKVLKIDTNSVHVESKHKEIELPANTVAICLEHQPTDGIAEALKKVVSLIVVVGDAIEPRRVTEAVLEGALAGLRL